MAISLGLYKRQFLQFSIYHPNTYRIFPYSAKGGQFYCVAPRFTELCITIGIPLVNSLVVTCVLEGIAPYHFGFTTRGQRSKYQTPCFSLHLLTPSVMRRLLARQQPMEASFKTATFTVTIYGTHRPRRLLKLQKVVRVKMLLLNLIPAQLCLALLV